MEGHQAYYNDTLSKIWLWGGPRWQLKIHSRRSGCPWTAHQTSLNQWLLALGSRGLQDVAVLSLCALDVWLQQYFLSEKVLISQSSVRSVYSA